MNEKYAEEMYLILQRLFTSFEFNPRPLFIEEACDTMHYDVRKLLERIAEGQMNEIEYAEEERIRGAAKEMYEALTIILCMALQAKGNDAPSRNAIYDIVPIAQKALAKAEGK